MKEAYVNRTPAEPMSLLECWRVVKKRKRLIGAFVAVAFVLSAVLSLVQTKIYASTASVLPPVQENSFNPGVLSNLPGGLAGLAGGVLGVKTPVELWVGILKSSTVSDSVISRFGLMKVYEAETIEDARKALSRNVKVFKSREDIIYITVEDTDPERAAGMAKAFVEELDRVNKSMVMTSGRSMRVFVEERLGETKKALAAAEEELKGFQERNRAVKLDDQARVIIDAIGSVKGQLLAKEVELNTLRSYATPDNPKVEILETEVAELREAMRELEEGGTKGERKGGESSFIPTSRMPDLALAYARLLREVKVQETLFELLTKQYELARIQEAKDSPTVQVLDSPKVPEKRVRPKRTRLVVLSTLGAFLISLFAAFLLEHIEKERLRESGQGLAVEPPERTG